jgi:hypothetical protein
MCNLFKLLLLWMFICLVSASCIAGEPKNSIRPTIARDTKAKVSRGSDVAITLDAIPSFGNQIAFRIQNPPLHGTLTDLHTTGDHMASVIYHHDNSKSPLVDSFTFRAQGTGQSMSESSHCTISIVPPPPLLVFDPPTIDFYQVMLSEKKQQNLTIINRGGETTEGRLILPKGFSAPLGDRYRLGDGESNTMTVEFDPMEERAYTGQATTQPSYAKFPLQLAGIGAPRFDLKNVIPLEWEVHNLSEIPLRISCAGGEGWIVPGDMPLLPHESRCLIFQQSEEGGMTNSTSSNAVVTVSDGLSVRQISLPPLTRFIPVMVQGVTPSDLGKIPIAAPAQIAFTLINRSEYPKHLTWLVASPSGGGSDYPALLELKGGESREIQYNWKPSLPGDATITLKVSEGKSAKSIKAISSTSHEFVWRATVLPATRTSSATSSDGNQGVMEGQEPPVDQSQASALTPVKVTLIPPVSGGNSVVQTSWMGTPSVLLRWDEKGLDLSCFKIEEEQLVLLEPFSFNKDDQGGLQTPKTKIILNPFDVSMAKKQGDQLTLKLRGLSPGWHHLVLSQFSKDGALEAQSQFQIRVPARHSMWDQLKVPLGVAVIGVLLFYFRRLRSS